MLRSLELLLFGSLSAVSPAQVVGASDTPHHARRCDTVCLSVRSDDGGMRHSVDMALEPLIATGMSVPVSLTRAIAERLARADELGMSEYLGEARDNPLHAAPPPSRTESLVALVGPLPAPRDGPGDPRWDRRRGARRVGGASTPQLIGRGGEFDATTEGEDNHECAPLRGHS